MVSFYQLSKIPSQVSVLLKDSLPTFMKTKHKNSDDSATGKSTGFLSNVGEIGEVLDVNN
jgi:hypothetical protein